MKDFLNKKLMIYKNKLMINNILLIVLRMIGSWSSRMIRRGWGFNDCCPVIIVIINDKNIKKDAPTYLILY